MCVHDDWALHPAASASVLLISELVATHNSDWWILVDIEVCY